MLSIMDNIQGRHKVSGTPKFIVSYLLPIIVTLHYVSLCIQSVYNVVADDGVYCTHDITTTVYIET